MSELGGGGGLGVLPQKIFGLYSVKSRNFRQNKHGNALSWKTGILCMTIWEKELGTWNLEVIMIFQTFILCTILASEASQKKNIIIRKKTTFGPPLLPAKYPHKTPPPTNLRGVRTPGPPPLWIRVCTCHLNMRLQFVLPVGSYVADQNSYKLIEDCSTEVTNDMATPQQ